MRADQIIVLAAPQFFKANPLFLKSFSREVGRCGGVSIGGQRTDLFPPTLLSAKRGLRKSNKEQPFEHLKTPAGKQLPDRPRPKE